MGTRLTKSDWIEFGLKQLAEQGHVALNANKLAQKLNVSRGSFYWHFKDMEAFESAILSAWQESTTGNAIKISNQASSAKQRLEIVIRTSLIPHELELAVRAWALVNPNVAEAVAKVDARRVAHVKSMLRGLGVAENAIHYRAVLLLWSGLGRTITNNKDLKFLDDEEIDQMIEMFTS